MKILINFLLLVFNFIFGKERLLDQKNGTCHNMADYAEVDFTVNTTDIKQEGKPVDIVSLLPDGGSCKGLRMIYAEDVDPNCRKYRKCQLLNESSVSKECGFRCNCNASECDYKLFGSQQLNVRVCDINMVL